MNLRDSRVYDTIEEDGKEKRVLNQNETTLAQQKQQAIKDAFAGWVWKDPQRRALLVKKYNELFNSTRPREYDGSHIHFVGMNPEINLREHQRNAVAHVLYGYNTLLAHEVGAGKSFEMAASAMELKRLGLCQKSLFVVPNHLTEQWASEFLRLYPNAKLLVTSKKDFEPGNRKKFCARIATGDYDAVIIGHSQFEKIPLSAERQERLIQEQMDEIEEAIEEAKAQVGEHFTVKQLEKLRKSLKQKLEKLQGADRKDDVVTFEQLGVDRLFVDESQAFKNLYLYTKVIRGKSSIDRDMIQQLLDENQAAIQAAQDALTAAQNKLEEIEKENKKAENDCSNLFTWASTYQNASFQQRQAILNQFIKEVRVGRDYDIEIILNVPLEEFEEFKSHSLSVRTPSGRKTDLKQAPVRGLGTPNGGIVVFDKTSGEAMNIMPKSSAHVTLRCQDE